MQKQNNIGPNRATGTIWKLNSKECLFQEVSPQLGRMTEKVLMVCGKNLLKSVPLAPMNEMAVSLDGKAAL